MKTPLFVFVLAANTLLYGKEVSALLGRPSPICRRDGELQSFARAGTTSRQGSHNPPPPSQPLVAYPLQASGELNPSQVRLQESIERFRRAQSYVAVMKERRTMIAQKAVTVVEMLRRAEKLLNTAEDMLSMAYETYDRVDKKRFRSFQDVRDAKENLLRVEQQSITGKQYVTDSLRLLKELHIYMHQTMDLSVECDELLNECRWCIIQCKKHEAKTIFWATDDGVWPGREQLMNRELFKRLVKKYPLIHDVNVDKKVKSFAELRHGGAYVGAQQNDRLGEAVDKVQQAQNKRSIPWRVYLSGFFHWWNCVFVKRIATRNRRTDS